MPVAIEEQTYLDAEETCDALGIKRQTLYAYVSRGVLRSYRLGMRRQRLYSLEEVDSLRALAPASAPVAPKVSLLAAEEWIGDK